MIALKYAEFVYLFATTVFILYGGDECGKVFTWLLIVTSLIITGCQPSEVIEKGEEAMNNEETLITNEIDRRPDTTELATFGLG